MEVSLKEAGKIILDAQKIAISSHIRPDGDNVGSTMAMYYLLKSLQKEVMVILDDDLPDNLFMIKDLDVYKKPSDLDCASNFDLLILLDVDQYRIGDVKNKVKALILNLDHHLTNARDTEYFYVDSSSPATCCVVYNLIKENNWNINKNIATCLYTGLMSDTGFFKYNATEYTFKVAADLVKYGADSKYIAEVFESRDFSSLKAMGKAIDSINLLYDGKVSIMILDKNLVESTQNTEGFVDIPRVIRGVDVAIMIKYDGENKTKISFRSKVTPVSDFAIKLGGGGHKFAAASVVYENIDTTKKLLKNILDGVFKND